MLTLVHTSDWHIGKAFSGFDGDVPATLRRARLDGIDRIVAVAKEAGARCVLVAGDSFDAPAVSDLTLRHALSRLASAPHLAWHVIPGNHDPDQPGGIFDRLVALGVPDNVRLHRSPGPVEMAPGVHLLPAPLKAKATAIDPTAWMDQAATPDGHARIGLAHGAVRDFSVLSRTAGMAAEPIAPSRAASAGLAYLALGDWHGTQEVAPATWYSGTHEPDAFAATERGSVLVARLDGGHLASVEVRPTRHFTWTERTIAMTAGADLSAVERALRDAGPARDRLVLRIAITGAATLDEIGAIERRLAAIAGEVMALDADLSQLTVIAGGEALEACGDRRLTQIASRLAARSAAGDGPAFDTALRLLHRLALIERSAAPAVRE